MRLKLTDFLKFTSPLVSHAHDVVFFRADASCSYSFEGKLYAPLIDSVVDIIEAKCSVVTFQLPYTTKNGGDFYNKTYIFNFYFFVVLTFHKLLKIFPFEIFSHYESRKCLWKLILKRVKPQILVGVMPDSDLCQACNELGIKIYDIQHGVVNSGHRWYAEKKCLLQTPSGFLCWDYEAVRFLENLYRGTEVEVIYIIHPWLEKFSRMRRNDLIVSNAHSKFCDQTKSNQKKILITLQWGLVSEVYPHRQNVHPVMCESLTTAILDSPSDLEWLIRIHPVQLQGEERDVVISFLENTFLKKTNVSWDWPTEAPLPLLLDYVDLHITDSSSTTIEASLMGVPTGLLNNEITETGIYQDYYLQQREAKTAELINNSASEILLWINNTNRFTNIYKHTDGALPVTVDGFILSQIL